MVRIPHCSSFQSSPNVQFSLGGSHGIGRRDKWLTSIPRNFCLKSISQVTQSIFLVSAVTLSCLLQHLCFLLFIPFSISIHYLGFLFMLNLVTAVVKELISISLWEVLKHARSTSWDSEVLTFPFPPPISLFTASKFLHPVQAHQYHSAMGGGLTANQILAYDSEKWGNAGITETGSSALLHNKKSPIVGPKIFHHLHRLLVEEQTQHSQPCHILFLIIL